jgi:Family of unknown function (DUF6411)
MIIAAVLAVCVVLLVLAFVFPRLSTHPQRGVDGVLGGGERGARSVPGRLGNWLAKPFSKSRRATSKSAGAGRRGRAKLPL